MVPPQSAKQLAVYCKERLNIRTVRIAGDIDTPCSRVGVLAGAWGGRAQIELFQRGDIDALICGETQEWETCEYVRDAVAIGQRKALIVLCHTNSEEAGMVRRMAPPPGACRDPHNAP